jgi:MFS family permease
MPQSAAFLWLWSGAFVFAVANGTLEAVANPLVATLFPHNRTHYLNLLHASWPAGMIIGGVAGALLGPHVHWKVLWALFLIPTAIYGLMFLGQHMPKSEASQKGLRLGEMLKDVGMLGALVISFLLFLFVRDSFGGILGGLTGSAFFASSAWSYIAFAAAAGLFLLIAVPTGFAIGHWLLFVLFGVHLLVGAVELGTDIWSQNILGNLLTPTVGKWLFVYTSAIMFALRFCANFIEKRLGLSPVGLLCVCAVLACIGLNLIASSHGVPPIMLALLVYAVGKTFFWPTMLAVASDRFPKTGAVAISIMGGIGMMSAGLIGAPGLGYCKDRFAGQKLQEQPAIFEAYKSPTPSRFYGLVEDVTGLDGTKLEGVLAKVAAAKEDPATAKNPLAVLSPEERAVAEANETGDRSAFRIDSFIPMIMAAIYLLLFLYFKAIGGYRPVHINPERVAGGVEAPVR